jgi:hypothetical protein
MGEILTVSDAPICDCPRRVPATSDDLVRKLIEAAAGAIANQWNDLAYRPEQIRGLMLELELANSGTVIDVTAHVTRRYVHRRER